MIILSIITNNHGQDSSSWGFCSSAKASVFCKSRKKDIHKHIINFLQFLQFFIDFLVSCIIPDCSFFSFLSIVTA